MVWHGLLLPFYFTHCANIRILQIHRIIKDSLRGRLGEKRIGHYTQILPEVAKHASEMERRADEAERETIKLKKVQYFRR